MIDNSGSELLLRGIGEISDELIAESSEEEIKKHKKKAARRRLELLLGGMAACLVLAVTVIFSRIDAFDGASNGESEPEVERSGDDIKNGAVIDSPEGVWSNDQSNSTITSEYVAVAYGAGTRFVCSRGSLAYVGYTPTTIFLRLELNTAQSEMSISLRKKGDPSAVADTNGVSDSLALKVNGERADALPTAPGSYELELDISELNADRDMDFEFTVNIFGERIELLYSANLTIVVSDEKVIKGPESFSADSFAEVLIDEDEILY